MFEITQYFELALHDDFFGIHDDLDDVVAGLYAIPQIYAYNYQDEEEYPCTSHNVVSNG